MEKESIFCLTHSLEQAGSIMDELMSRGIDADDISVVFSDCADQTGKFIGGAWNWLVKIGSLEVPGLGSIRAAGPLFSGLSGVLGSASEGVSRLLMEEGIPRYEVKRYIEKIGSGKVLISLHVEDPSLLEDIKSAFCAARVPEAGFLNSRSQYQGYAFAG